MLESLITSVPSDYAEKYLDNFDKKMLSISLTKGDVEVRDLSLKAEALEGIHPALKVLRGFVSKVKIELSLTKLKSIPVQVMIDDVLILASPEAEFELSQENIARHLQDKLEEKLRLALSNELLIEEGIQSTNKKSKEGGFVSGLLKAIVNNLVVKITNVHVRLEDTLQNFCFGVSIGGIEAHTVKYVTEKGKTTEEQCFVKEDYMSYIKRDTIDSIAMYADTGFVPLSATEDKQLIKQYLKDKIATKPSEEFNYIIEPISIKLLLEYNMMTPNDGFTGPIMRISLILTNINLNISMEQLSCLLNQAEQFSRKSDVGMIEYRPNCGLGEEWWQYLLVSADEEEYENKLMYPVYIKLFSKHYLQVMQLSKKELEEFKRVDEYKLLGEEKRVLETLNEEFSLKEINYCREQALDELAGENYKELAKKQYSVVLTQEQVEERLRIHLEKPEKEVLPKNFVIMNVQVKVDAITLALTSKSSEKEVEFVEALPEPIGIQFLQKEMLELKISNIELEFVMKSEEKILVRSRIESLQMFDEWNVDSQFPVILRPLPTDKRFISDAIKSKQFEGDDNDVFMDVTFEKPSESGQDAEVRVDLQPLSLIFTYHVFLLMEEIMSDAKVLSNEQQDNYIIAYLADNVQDEFGKIQNYSKNAIELAVKNHLTLDVDMMISAPVIICPALEKEGSYLIANFGNLIVKTIEEAEEEKIYDNYLITLQNMCIFTADTEDELVLMFENQHRLNHEDFAETALRNVLLYPFCAVVKVRYCFMPNYIEAERLNLEVRMLEFIININDVNTTLLILLLQKIMSKVQTTEPKIVEAPAPTKDINKEMLRELGEYSDTQTSTEESESIETSHGLTTEFRTQTSREQIAAYVLTHAEIRFAKLGIVLGAVENGSVRAVISAAISSMSGSFMEHPYRNEINFNIASFSFEDRINGRQIVQTQEGEELFELYMKQKSKRDPTYENVDMELSCAVGSISINYYPALIAVVGVLDNALLTKFKPLMIGREKIVLEQETQVLDLQTSEKLVFGLVETARDREGVSENHYQMRIAFSTKTFLLRVSDAGRKLCELELLKSDINFDMLDKQKVLNVRCEGMQIVDNCDSTLHKQVLAFIPNANEQILLNLRLIDPKSADFCGFATEIVGSITVELKITVMLRFVQNMMEFATEQLILLEPILGDTSSTSSSEKEETSSIPSLMRLEFFMIAPKVIFPLSDKSNTTIELDMGQIEVSSAEFIGSVLGDEERLPIAGFMVKLSNFEISSADGREFLNPIAAEVKYFAPVTCQSTEQAVLGKTHPRTSISVDFDNKMEIGISKEDYQFIMQFLWSENNLGFNIVDSKYADDREFERLKNIIMEYKDKNQEFLRQESEDRSLTEELEELRSRELSFEVEKIRPVLEARKELLERQKAQKAPNTGFALEAKVKFCGLEIAMREGKTARLAFEIADVGVEFATVNQKSDLRVELEQILLADLYVQQAPAILETTQPLTLEMSLSDQENKLFVDSVGEIRLSYVPTPIQFVLGFISIPEEKKSEEFADHRNRCIKMQEKCKKMEKYISIQKESAKFLSENADITVKQRQSLVRSQAVFSAFQHTNLEEIKRTVLDIRMPALQIIVPEDATNENSAKMQISIKLSLQGEISSIIRQKNNVSGKILYYKDHNLTEIKVGLNQLVLEHYASGGAESDVIPKFSMGVSLCMNENTTLIKGIRPFLRKNATTGIDVSLNNSAFINFTHEQLAFIMRVVASIQETMETLNVLEETSVVEEEAENSLEDAESTAESTLSTDYGVSEICAIKNYAQNELFAAEVVNQNAKFEVYTTVGELEFPVFNNQEELKFVFSTENCFEFTFIDDRNGVRPIFRFICRCNSLNLGINSVYEIANTSEMNMSALVMLELQHYNTLERKYENIIAPIDISAELNDTLVRDENGEGRNVENINVEISDIHANFEPLLLQQVKLIDQFFQEFTKDTNRQESIYYSPIAGKFVDRNKSTHRSDIVLSNLTNIVISVDSEVIGPYGTSPIALHDDAMINIIIEQEEQEFHVQDGEYQSFVVNGVDFYVYFTIVEEQETVYLRNRFVLRNMSRTPMRFFTEEAESIDVFSTADERIMVELEGVELEISLPIANIATILLGSRHYRVSSEEVRIAGAVLMNYCVYPTFVICNECLDGLVVNGVEIAPMRSLELFINPRGTAILDSLQFGDFRCERLTIASELENAPGLSDTSDQAKQLRKEAQTSQLIYTFASHFVLASDSQQKYHLGIRREMCEIDNISNGFSHKLLIHPFYILRNCFALNGFTEQSEFYIKSAKGANSSFEISAQNGEFIQLGLPKNAVVDFELRIDKSTYILAKSVPLETQLNAITTESDNAETPYFELKFPFTQNSLSRTITCVPGRIMRNYSSDEVYVLLGDLPLSVDRAMQMILAPEESSIVLSGAKYMFIQHDREISSAVDITCIASNALEFNDGKILAVETVRDANTVVIDIFEAGALKTVEIVNNTQNDIFVEELLSIQQFVKGGAPPMPSIRGSRRHECPMGEKLLFNLDDVSIPPFLEIGSGKDRLQIALIKFGKRKPKMFRERMIFTQLDVKQEKRTLVLSDHPIERDTMIQKAQKDIDYKTVEMHVNLAIKQIELSIYSLQRTNEMAHLILQEIMRVEIEGTNISLYQMPESMAVNALVRRIEILNPQKKAQYVTVVKIGGDNETAILLQAEKINNAPQFSGIMLYAAPIAVNIDQNMCETVVSFISGMIDEQMRHKDKEYQDDEIDQVLYNMMLPILENPPMVPLSLSQTFIGKFYLSDVVIDLNTSVNDLSFLEINFVASFAAMLVTILFNEQNACLKFTQFAQKAVFASNKSILDNLIQHYRGEIAQLLFEVFKSASFIGAMSSSSAQLKQSSADVFDGDDFAQRMRGIAGVGKSLLASYGGAVNGVASTCGKLIGVMSFDQEYVRAEQKRLQNSYKGAGNAMKNAGIAAGTGILEGISGIIMQPVRGGETEGAKGVFKGIGRGLIGIFTKPVAGLASAVGNIGVALEVGAIGTREERQVTEKVWKNGIIDEEEVADAQ